MKVLHFYPGLELKKYTSVYMQFDLYAIMYGSWLLFFQVGETDAKMAVANGFTIFSSGRCLVVAASSEAEKAKWMEDLQHAIDGSKKSGPGKVLYPSLKSNSQ